MKVSPMLECYITTLEKKNNFNDIKVFKQKWKKYEFPWYMRELQIDHYPMEILIIYPPISWLCNLFK
jgi:hypothetical protein